MIQIYLGNVGSGKTALAVREMYHNKLHRVTYTNIKTPLKNVRELNPKMIIKQEIVDHKRSRSTGELEPVYKNSLNIDYWKNIEEPINVTLDEAHSILNARKSMSKINVIVTDWLALIRRVLGETDAGQGNLTFITQLPNRLDTIARDMATNILYCVMHYRKTCTTCKTTWQENSEMPETYVSCFHCGKYTIKKHSHTVEVWHFSSMKRFEMWDIYGQKSFYKHYYINDIQKYFELYDTLQWDNLFSDFY